MSNSAEIRQIAGRAIPLCGNDIDTDRIIPARFLRAITFEGLGDQVFRDERFDGDNPISTHPFNDPLFQGGSILLVNTNFGCGSSREHAPQALLRFGIRAIIGASFAEIFAGNCTNLGIPVFTTAPETAARLQEKVKTDPDTQLILDIEAATVRAGEETIRLEIADSARKALLEGSWDTLSLLLKNGPLIEKKYQEIPYLA